MGELGIIMFDTSIGSCGLAWGERGIVAVQLPEADPQATRDRLRRRVPEGREVSPPQAVREARDGIVALLRGEPIDLSGVGLDLHGVAEFDRAVYAAARGLGPGATCSYGELAARLDAPGAARAVGRALGRNPCPIVVPCHRVVAAGGQTGGFSAHGGAATKLRLLAIERVHARNRQLPLFAPPAP